MKMAAKFGAGKKYGRTNITDETRIADNMSTLRLIVSDGNDGSTRITETLPSSRPIIFSVIFTVRLPLFLLLLFTLPLSAQQNGISKKHKHYGYRKDGQWLIKPRYDSVREFADGVAAVMRKGKWGYIDSNGRKLIATQYHSATDFHGGLAAVKYSAGAGWNVVNKNGAIESVVTFDTIVQTDSLLFAAHFKTFSQPDDGFHVYVYPGNDIFSGIKSANEHDGKIFLHRYYYNYGDEKYTVQILSSSGKIITPEIISVDSLLQKTVIIHSYENNHEALLNIDGGISACYTFLLPLDAGYYLTDSNDRSGVIDHSFRTIIPAKYVKITQSGLHFIVQSDSSLSLADTSGRFFADGLTAVRDLGNGCFSVQQSKRDSDYTFINANGITSAQRYAFIYPAKENIVRVISTDCVHYSYIDADGKQIAPWYDRAVIRKEYISYVQPDPLAKNTSMEDEPNGIRVGLALSTFFLSEILPLIGNSSEGYYSVTFGSQPAADNNKLRPYENFYGYSGGYYYYYGTDFQNGHAIITQRSGQKASRKYPLEEFVTAGAIDTNGTQVVPAIYTNIAIADTCFIVQSGSLNGIADGHGKLLLKPAYSTIGYLGEGCFSVRLNSLEQPKLALWNVSNRIGLYYGDFIYSQIGPFVNGKSHVKDKNGAEYDVNKSGTRIE